MATGFLIKASEVTMHDPLYVYTNVTGGEGGTPGKSSTAPGKTPSNAGGGGGGATYIFLTYIRGGAGACGEFKLYY